MLSECFTTKRDAEVMKKLNEENRMLADKLIEQYSQNQGLASQRLVYEQINCQLLMQESDKVDGLERRIMELTENMDRREQYMQTKEKKWGEVENYLQTLYDDNEELFYKMQDLKLTIEGDVKITNIITENEKVKKRNKVTKKKLKSLRKRLLDPYFLKDYQGTNSAGVVLKAG